MQQLQVLDKGFVRLDASCADDLSVVNSARVSFHKRHEFIETNDDKLIGFLLKNRHGTPFEANFMRFHIKAPLFVFREWHRHRIGISINEWSARYSELQPDFYYPDLDNVRTQVGKPGNYSYVMADTISAETFLKTLQDHCIASYNNYQYALTMSIAKEQARMFLPVNIYSEMYWSCNARSLMHFLSLRNHEKAQYEIRVYAEILENIWSELMPITHEYFVEYGRIAP